MKSIIQELGPIPLAPHTSERIYMREFRKADGLPFDLARWQPTVDAMLAEVDTDGPIYLMVDQSFVAAGVAHRRPGVHIDGYWRPAKQAHDTSGHVPPPLNPPPPPKIPMHSMSAGSHGHIFKPNMPDPIILASNIAACRAFIGEFTGAPGKGGDCSHVDTAALQSIILAPNIAYAGNVAMLHESLPVAHDCLRTVVRLNVPGWSPA